jgi:hypothetical protein
MNGMNLLIIQFKGNSKNPTNSFSLWDACIDVGSRAAMQELLPRRLG